MEPQMTIPDEVGYTPISELGENIPRRGNRLSRGFWLFVLRLFGWRADGEVPNGPKFVFVGAPHTSNLDFFLTAVVMAAMGVRGHFVMKHQPFVGPVGWLLRWLGGIPLDRDRTRDFVSQMVDEFNERDQFLLAIMPEGTRGKDRDSSTKGWRSGFYYIARGAGVPLVMVLFDYANKWMRVGPTYWPGESYEVDLPQIQALFAGVEGRNPERMMALGQGAAGGG